MLQDRLGELRANVELIQDQQCQAEKDKMKLTESEIEIDRLIAEIECLGLELESRVSDTDYEKALEEAKRENTELK
jgi:hypothetical protein